MVGQLFSYVLDDQAVYYVSQGQLWRAPKNGGGSPTALVGPGTSPPEDLATDGLHVYYAVESSRDTGSIRRVPVGGGPSEMVAQSPFLERLALDATNVYWKSYSPERLLRAPKSGGVSTELAAIGPLSTGIAVHGSGVYFATGNYAAAGALWRVALAGGAPEALLCGEGQMSAPNVVGDTLFWFSADCPGVEVTCEGQSYPAGRVLGLTLPGGPARTYCAGRFAFAGLAVDQDHLYVGDYRGLLRVPR